MSLGEKGRWCKDRDGHVRPAVRMVRPGKDLVDPKGFLSSLGMFWSCAKIGRNLGKLPLESGARLRSSLDKEGAVWIRLEPAGKLKQDNQACFWVFVLSILLDMKHESSGAVKIQEENKWVWPRLVKTALGSCEIWSNHAKGEPLMERAADGGQTERLKCEDQLSLDENISLEKIEDVYENKILCTACQAAALSFPQRSDHSLAVRPFLLYGMYGLYGLDILHPVPPSASLLHILSSYTLLNTSSYDLILV
ncbi:hypothetical protein F2Q70_00025741 [Brassica cretica]|uniref:Uncharacterized protein n=1 Tax=Brassica cretica TaxID=69181 RepID=A0A8S9LG69_BRACR|nr:hypothetical protein F2Q70_00025741 [Brassica cretica]